MNKLKLSLLILLSSSLLVLSYEQNIEDSTYLILGAAATSELALIKAVQEEQEQRDCITYDVQEKAIRVSCKTPSHLIDIYNRLGKEDILAKEKLPQRQGNWILNANLIIESGSSLVIDSNDTQWLKIVADGKTENSIEVFGSLKINSVKITSWNPSTNYYAIDHETRELYLNKSGSGAPRPFILVRGTATGKTDITNSELAYLGYKCIGGSCSGIRYFGGNGSIIKGNNIHHNGFGFYSNGVANITYQDNDVHHNSMYGIDPHTATHDMNIKNNTVHDNGSIGIVCSLDCYNITIENNLVYSNAKDGILLSRNTYNSSVMHNVIQNETTGIAISESNNNEVYNNTISNIKNGIKLGNMSSENSILNNLVENATRCPILVRPSASGNTFYSNVIINATENRPISSPINNCYFTSNGSNTTYNNEDNLDESLS